MNRSTLLQELDSLLSVSQFQDYAPNGLQVEGRENIDVVATAVTASLDAIEAAIELGADVLLVHHGYFWKNEPLVLTGMKAKRIQRLLEAKMNLIAYHLPLDAHGSMGNNAGIAKALSWTDDGADVRRIWRSGQAIEPQPIDQLLSQVQSVMQRAPLHLAGHQDDIRRVAWCSGGGQSYFSQAIDAGVDLFLTGEVSEQCYHMARESGVHFIAAGHHATERFGVKALGNHLQAHWGLQHHYIELNNPV